MDVYEARAMRVYRNLGPRGLELLARCDRSNADTRYQRGEIDLALMCINRARAAEKLLEWLTTTQQQGN